MSKSKGNVIDPLELIKIYGADSLRFTLANLSTQGRDIKLSNKLVENSRNFLTKYGMLQDSLNLITLFLIKTFSQIQINLC